MLELLVVAQNREVPANEIKAAKLGGGPQA